MFDVTFIKLLDQGVIGYVLFATLVFYNIAKLITEAHARTRADRTDLAQVMTDQFTAVTLASENLRRELTLRNDQLEDEIKELRDALERYMTCTAHPCPVRDMLKKDPLEP